MVILCFIFIGKGAYLEIVPMCQQNSTFWKCGHSPDDKAPARGFLGGDELHEAIPPDFFPVV